MNPDAQLAAKLALDAGHLLLELRAKAEGSVEPAELRRLGDAQSNDFLIEAINAARPGDAILSEESADSPERLQADRVWIIDPLDGTREFAMSGRTDWAVHVALWERAKEIAAAAVSQPALGKVHGTDHPQVLTASRTGPPRIVVSDSRPPEFSDELADVVGAEITTMGSAGAKAMAVLRGEADAYVHAGGQWEWDSAAPVGVALAGGLHASRVDGSPLRYNQPRPYLPDLLICRPDRSDSILAALDRILRCDPSE